MAIIFKDRNEAAQKLGEPLQSYAGRDDTIVLGLPRGGVPVAVAVADAIGAAVDIIVVRKLGFPGQPELAMGAIASGGVRVENPRVMGEGRVSQDAIEEVEQRERQELERREQAYRGDRPLPQLADRCVILVDDGLATGSTMRAAASAVRQQNPKQMVVAVPVAPQRTIDSLRDEVDEVVCLSTPESFFGIGEFYEDFSQVSDDQVQQLLSQAWQNEA